MKKHYLLLSLVLATILISTSATAEDIPYAIPSSTWVPSKTNNGWWPALSPDGKYIAYGNWGESWVTDISTGQNWDFRKPIGLPSGARCIAGQWIQSDTLSFVCELSNKDMARYEVSTTDWIAQRTSDNPNLVAGNMIVARDGHWASYLATTRIVKDSVIITDNKPGGALSISEDILVHACDNNNTSICVWEGESLVTTYDTATPLHTMDTRDGYIVYGGYGPIHGITPDGQDVDLTATAWQTEYIPQIVMKDGEPWIASSTCTPAPEECFTLIRPWGERKGIAVSGNGGPASMSVIYSNNNFIVAYATDQGRLSVQTIPADSERVDLCGEACNDTGDTTETIITGGRSFSPRTIPGIPEGYMGLDQLLVFFLNWSKYILGIAVFVMIFFGGVKWFFSQGNPSEISKAQDIIKNAVIGAILLLSAYLILYTVNPDLISGSFTLPGIKTVPPTNNAPGGTGTTNSCQDLRVLASQNNEPYPRKNSAEVDTLIADIKSKLSGVNVGRMYTFDESYEYCNYTRGNRLCGKCSHAVNSCHYGGRTGKDGALAIDFAARGSVGDRIISAAMASGAKDARCENSSGVKVSCSSSSATHVHVTSKSCDSN